MSCTERERLLAELPSVYRRDAMPVAALRLRWPGAGTLTVAIADGSLTLVGADGAPSQILGLDDTLGDVVMALQGLGLEVTLANPAAGALRAAMLLGDGPLPVPAPPADPATLTRWSSVLWSLLDPIAQALEASAARVDVALTQLNLLQAAAFFAEFWGGFTGITRRPGELDGPYTARQLHELLRPRENNEALAAIIEEETGRVVTEIRDLRRDVFRCSATPLRGFPLPGWRYNAATAEVRVEGFVDRALEYLVRSNIAAGVTAFLVGRLAARVPSTLAVRVRGAQIGAPPHFVVGTTTVGVGQVG